MKHFALLILVFLLCVQVCVAKDFYTKGSEATNAVALSFDDGPGKSTENILKILDDYDVKATFFVLGCVVDEHKDLLKEIHNKGHEIASHTYGHFNFYKYDKDDLEYRLDREIKKNIAVIKKYTGVNPTLVRYPHGYDKQPAIDVAVANGCKVVNWTYGCDWETERSAENMYNGYRKNIKPGTIFLMHDSLTNKKVLSFLPKLIEDIKEKGCKIVTVGELLNIDENK